MTLRRRIVAVAVCAGISGCGLLPPSARTTEPAPPRSGEIRSAQAAKDAVTVGKSTKGDVRAALGEATIIDFDSGYAVWLYRERLPEKTPPPPSELVLLFAPSGILARTRVR